MSLGVLNNLNAIYAENNLNNSNTSLSKVLNELSSGSKITSGADDAAGLSLVNGLQANQQALTQSKTNATEGVGLLQVADGALSQVTSLLNRAVTLATEASNGTLNSSQDTAANQEYQSILSEISNIGSTTTYNGSAVFNTKTNIYTGDSSTAGSSINQLNIRALSSSNVGDSGGVMAYSNGANSVFVNLSSSTVNAQATDALNTSGTTTINVNYLVKGSDNSETAASTTITVGGASGFANTANGLISAINASGLGLSANFATQSQAGVAGGGTQTGIQITGGLVSVGVDPSTTSTSGTLSLTGSGSTNLLTQGQTIAIQSGTQAAISVNVTSNIQTLDDLATAINSASTANASNGGTQVVATVVTDSAGVQSISLTDQTAGEGTLSVTTTQGTSTPTISATVASGNPVALSFTAGGTGASTIAGTSATASLGISGIGANAAAAPLTGSLVLSNGSSGNVTITMGSSATGDATHINLSSANSTLTGLANALNGSSTAATALGVTASVTSSGLSLTSNTENTTIAGNSAGLTATPSLALSSVVNGASSTAATVGTTTLSLVNGVGGATAGFNGTDTLAAGSSIVITNGSTNVPGTAITFAVGAGTNDATHFYTGAGNNTVTNLLGIIGSGGGATAAGIASAAVVNNQIVLTSATAGTTINAVSSLVDKTPTVGAGTVTAAVPVNAGTASAGASFSMASVIAPDANADPLTGTGDALSGSIVLTNGNPGTALTITMNNATGSVGANTINLTTSNSTLTGLMDAINGSSGITGAAALTTALNITAAVGADNNALTFTTSSLGTVIGVNTTSLSSTSTLNFTNPVTGDVGVYASGTVALTDGGEILGNGGAASGAYSGSIVISNNGVNDTFVMGSNAADTYNVAGSTFHVNSTQLGDLITAINTEGSDVTNGGVANLGLTAVRDSATGGILLQSSTTGVTGLNAVSSLTATVAETATQGSQGATVVTQAQGAQVTYGTGTNNSGSDVISGSIVIKNSGFAGGADTTFTMGGTSESGLGTNNITVNGNTLDALAQAINNDSAGTYSGTTGIGLSAVVGANGLTVTSNSTSSVISDVSSTLVDNYGSSVATNPGAQLVQATYASAVLGANEQVGASDALSGSIVLNNGGSNYTFTLASSNAGSTATSINTNGATLQDLAESITASGVGLNASVVNGALHLQSTSSATSISVVGTPTLKDTATETFVGGSGTAGTPGSASTANVDLAGALTTAQGSDVLTGSIVLTGTGGAITFTMGANENGGTTLQSLATAITSDSTLGIRAQVVNSGLSLTMTSDVNTAITVGANTLNDTLGNTAASATLSGFRSVSDTLSNGTISFTLNGTQEAISVNSGSTVQDLVNQINTGAQGNQVDPYGVHATYSNGSITMTSDTYGTAGNIVASTTNVADTTTGVGVSYTQSAAYSTGISNSTGANSLYDSSTQSAQTGASAAYTNFVANTGGSSGIATISYSDSAGVSLSATDLSNQTDAQAALTALNAAITAVAAQDGYIGAQINTLNAVSQVLSTQQENVQSAQNAVQATDYASATSDMSKYEILSQTGIAALAQANSVQQEVTKLLQ
jgi:flagellin